eukprot:Seg353.5 transcript_id=Seg353.5/GoldUCD/mRNA.D3Y31 product="Transcriptional adapter 3-A" protein_id=Seg353.5/GoldUCD/D3Y31
MMSELPLQFHDFAHLDHIKRCPKYSSILSRPSSTIIQPSELDEIYTDLESLLGAANIRHRQLESELKILGDWVEKKDRKNPFELELLTNISGKRSGKASFEERPLKKQKPDDPKSGKLKGKVSGKVPKSEPDPEVYISKPKPATDMPNKFWATVEPYCADITADDLKILEDVVNTPTEEGEFFKVPTLGKHYTQVWAQEDLNEEQREGSKVEKRRGGSALSSNYENTDFDKFSKNVDVTSANNEEETCPFGALTQRLISALVDENILAPMDESDISDLSKQAGSNEGSSNASSQVKHFTIPHARALENAIKEELANLGFIESHSDEEDLDFDDEVLMELRRHQSELRTIMQKNKRAAETLLDKAQKEMQRQELKQRAKVVDAEVMDSFRKVTAAKQKKRNLTKKEKDTAWKALRDRESILKLLDSQK